MLQDLSALEYNPYYKTYIDKTTHSNVVKGLIDNLESISQFYGLIPDSKYNYAYAKNKWTINQIMLHIIDTERIFAYRALRIARGDKTPLAGFDQDIYVDSAKVNSRSPQSILEEYNTVRLASVSLFKSFDVSELMQIGEASGSPISVRAIGYIITGHENHHMAIIKERYL
jgi:hypothetical protein